MDRRLPDIDAATDPFALASRAAAVRACRDALSSRGPILVTGAAGVGKTWLLQRVIEDSPYHWIDVDAAPDMTAAELLTTCAYRLGASSPVGGTAMARLALAEALALHDADGCRTGLILDEAHLASDEILEEIRLLSNRSMREDGLAAIILVGQTSLLRRFESAKQAGLESRLVARVHLLPLDADETSEWLGHLARDLVADRSRVEHWHRETGGNPQKLRRLVARFGANAVDRGRPDRAATAVATAIPQVEPAQNSEALLPAKPPLRVEDGLIEVGWDADPDAESSEPQLPADPPQFARQGEPVDDRYAALQAWDEWAKNQGRVAAPMEEPDGLDEDDLELSDDPLDATPDVWAEGGQSFGPYSQLFSRLRPLKEAE